MGDYHVIIEFGKGVHPDMQGRAMLHLERWLREQGVPVEVFKHTKPDDSKLRLRMTPEERERL